MIEDFANTPAGDRNVLMVSCDRVGLRELEGPKTARDFRELGVVIHTVYDGVLDVRTRTTGRRIDEGYVVMS